MHIDSLDHLVLTVKDLQATCDFYARILGMRVVTFGDNRKALSFGEQKINLHQQGKEFEPRAERPTAGSADLCFITSTPMAAIIAHLQANGIVILAGPEARAGARGPLRSVYFRDPDLNLIEVANEDVNPQPPGQEL
ncbi:MAG: VOC family protein [Candidatus Promineifilaceae bacterium]|nr:VOC family protein [Candidatus Promineifilaceae bacterium]